MRLATSTLFIACTLIWGTTWYAITVQLDAVAPEAGVALRFALAAALLMAWCAWRGIGLAYNRREHLLFALQGLAGFALSYILIYHAERFIVSGLVATGYAAMPLANMVVMGQQRRGVTQWAPIAWAMLYGAIGAALVAALLGRPWDIAWSPSFVWSLLYLAIGGSVLAFGAYYLLLQRVGPARAAYIGVSTPIVALFVSSMLEGFDWQWQTWAGIVLVVAGSLLGRPMRNLSSTAGATPAQSRS